MTINGTFVYASVNSLQLIMAIELQCSYYVMIYIYIMFFNHRSPQTKFRIFIYISYSPIVSCKA